MGFRCTLGWTRFSTRDWTSSVSTSPYTRTFYLTWGCWSGLSCRLLTVHFPTFTGRLVGKSTHFVSMRQTTRGWVETKWCSSLWLIGLWYKLLLRLVWETYLRFITPCGTRCVSANRLGDTLLFYNLVKLVSYINICVRAWAISLIEYLVNLVRQNISESGSVSMSDSPPLLSPLCRKKKDSDWFCLLAFQKLIVGL